MISNEFDKKYYHPFVLVQVFAVMFLLLGLFAIPNASGDALEEEPVLLEEVHVLEEVHGVFTELCLFTPKGDECVALAGFFAASNPEAGGKETLIVYIPNLPEKEGGVIPTMGKSRMKFQM